MNFYAPLALVLALAVSSEAGSCPSYLQKKNIRDSDGIGVRSDMSLFVLSAGKWEQIPMQIDPADRGGYLQFFQGDKSYQDWEVEPSDRISYNVDLFGNRFNEKIKAPCDTDFIYEVKSLSGQKKYAYLVDCGRDKDFVKKVFSKPTRHDSEKNTVFSTLYNYRYHPTNHMMFDQILVKPDGKTEYVAGRNSDQRIRADVRRFFTMNFNNDDIESTLAETREGDMALLGRLTFFLRVMFFKIDLKLNTVVSFFEDSVHMPMTINTPVDASRMTKPTSGMIFSWFIPKNVVWNKELSSMPDITPDLIRKGKDELAKLGLKNCKGNRCRFTLVGSLDGFQWSTEFSIPRTLVANGFFPQFMHNAHKDLVRVGWDKEDKHNGSEPAPVGIYYETSGLTKGQHEFDFWIKIGTDDLPVQRKCPRPSRVTKKITVSERIRELNNRGLADELLFSFTDSEVEAGLKVIKNAAAWQELLDSLEYDVDTGSLPKLLDFNRRTVLVYVGAEKEVGQGVISLTRSKTQVKVRHKPFKFKNPEKKPKSIHIVVADKIRKPVVWEK